MFIYIWFLKGDQGTLDLIVLEAGKQKRSKNCSNKVWDSLAAETAVQYVRRRTQDAIELE